MKLYGHTKPVRVLIAAVIIITPNRKQLKCPWAAEWIKRLWYVHTMQSNSATRRNYQCTQLTWRSHKGIIMPSERSQSQVTHRMISFVQGLGDGGGFDIKEIAPGSSLGVMELLWILIILVMLVVTWIYTCVKISRTVHQKKQFSCMLMKKIIFYVDYMLK